LILTSMMKRRCSSTRAFVYVSVLSAIKVAVGLNLGPCTEHDSIRRGWLGE
jgi:hypothetical protein